MPRSTLVPAVGTTRGHKQQEARLLGSHLGDWLPQSPSTHFTDEQSEAQTLDLGHPAQRRRSWESSSGPPEAEALAFNLLLPPAGRRWSGSGDAGPLHLHG